MNLGGKKCAMAINETFIRHELDNWYRLFSVYAEGMSPPTALAHSRFITGTGIKIVLYVVSIVQYDFK